MWKEIDEICKKCDTLLQHVETALLQNEKDLETYCSKVYANKLLAEALTHKYENVKAAGSKGTQQSTFNSLEPFMFDCVVTTVMTN